MSAPEIISAASAPRLANRWPVEQRMLHAALLAILPANLILIALLWN